MKLRKITVVISTIDALYGVDIEKLLLDSPLSDLFQAVDVIEEESE